jgi:fructose-1,6-bisphosphatase/inositol monophosphatase family enzyme
VANPNDSFLPAMSAIAREAGALLMQYFHQHLKIQYKGEADLVTAADRAAEVLIRERIREQWPTHDVLGEEQGLSDRGSDYRCMWIRWTARRTLHTDIQCFAFRWDWNKKAAALLL